MITIKYESSLKKTCEEWIENELVPTLERMKGREVTITVVAKSSIPECDGFFYYKPQADEHSDFTWEVVEVVDGQIDDYEPIVDMKGEWGGKVEMPE